MAINNEYGHTALRWSRAKFAFVNIRAALSCDTGALGWSTLKLFPVEVFVDTNEYYALFMQIYGARLPKATAAAFQATDRMRPDRTLLKVDLETNYFENNTRHGPERSPTTRRRVALHTDLTEGFNTQKESQHT